MGKPNRMVMLMQTQGLKRQRKATITAPQAYNNPLEKTLNILLAKKKVLRYLTLLRSNLSK
jgi:hypothetical protein